MSNWAKRYAARLDACQLCGQMDDGSHQIVSQGKCRNTEECEKTQAEIASGEATKPSLTTKKKRRAPYVDRKGNAPCMHPECFSENKRYPVNELSFQALPNPMGFCMDHYYHAGSQSMPYVLWKERFRRK